MCYEMHAWIRKSKFLSKFSTLRGQLLRNLLKLIFPGIDPITLK